MSPGPVAPSPSHPHGDAVSPALPTSPTGAESSAWLGRAWQLAQLDPDTFRRVALEAYPSERPGLLRARFRYDVIGFAAWSLPDLTNLPFNEFHRAQYGATPPMHWRDRAHLRLTRRAAVAAPRGIAKSTTSRIRAYHRVCYGLEAAVLVGSTPDDNATSWVRAVAQWAQEAPGYVRDVYGDVTASGAERVTLRARAGATVIAGKPFRGAVRGWNEGGLRPSLVVLDDIEDPKRVRSPELRSEDRAKLTADWLKLGPKEGGLEVWWDGTILHTDAALQRALAGTDPFRGWHARRWQAVEAWPTRADLWERYRDIYGRLSVDPDERRRRADRYLKANRRAMLEGVRVLDPVALPIDEVERRIVDEGMSSVLTELQNEPRDPALQLYDVSTFGRCKVERTPAGALVIARHDGARVTEADIVGRRMHWDPSAGTTDGDPAAIVVLLRDRAGYTYVVDGWIGWSPTSAQEAIAWDLAERWAAPGAGIVCGLEGNGFQSELAKEHRRTRSERAAAGRFDAMTLHVVTTTENKEARIASMEPAIANRWLQFAHGLPEVGMAMFDDFRADGSATHDDWPDAVHAGRQHLTTGKTGLSTTRIT